MKFLSFIIVGVLAGSAAFAGSFTCRSRTQNFVLKQSGEESLFLVYECDKSITSCTPGMIFERLGFEEEGSFTLHGQRSNGQRSVISMIKTKTGWTATLTGPYGKSLQDVLTCEPYRK